MDSLSTGFWAIGLTLGVVVVVWLWSRIQKDSGPGDMRTKMKRTIRGWVGAVGQEDFTNEKEEVERWQIELSTRLNNVERGLTHQDQLEELAVGLRQRLHRLEQIASPKLPESHHDHPIIPRTILRLGIRMTLSDLIRKDLGIIRPEDLSDSQLDKVFQGPFCRNCLRSLVSFELTDGDKAVRQQCRHCLLAWRMDPTNPTVPLRHLKREVYELLDAEFRKTGSIGQKGHS